jgi:dCTP deaminase
MILSDRDIKKAIKNGRILIEPYHPRYIQPASLDVHLGNRFLLFKRATHYVIDVKKPVDNYMTEHTIRANTPFILHPGEFALGMIYEKTGVGKDLVARLEGKSSLGRLGIIIHATAGFIHPGNCLNLTLELHNVGVLPVMLYYKMPIAQLSFEELTSPPETLYGAKKGTGTYQGATTVQASQIWKSFLPHSKRP